MQVLFALACGLAVALAMPVQFEVVEDDVGEQYYLVPLRRERRDTKVDIQGPDLTGIVKHEGTIVKGDNYNLDGSVYAAKDLTILKHLKPELFGADLKFAHDNGLAATLAADRFQGGPTDIRAGLNYNLFQTKNIKFDLAAEYARQFGGPYGTGRPDAGIFFRTAATF